MTDTSTPHAEPVTVVDDAPESLSFDTQMDAWLNHDFGVSEEADAAAAAEGGDGPEAATGEAVVAPAPASPGESKDTPANAEPKAAPTAGNEQQAPAAEGPDPALMAQMLGVSEVAPAPTTATPQTPAQPATEAEPEYYMPLPSSLRLDDNLVNTILGSEDPNQQKAALGTLLANHGNAILALMDKRMKEHYVPAAVNRVQAAQTHQRAIDEMNKDFYSAFPDLVNHKGVVVKAFKVLEQNQPDLKYGPEARDKAGNLARATLKQMGLATPAPAPAATTAAAPVKAKPKASVGYQAGGARPAGAGSTDPNSAESVFDDIMKIGF